MKIIRDPGEIARIVEESTILSDYGIEGKVLVDNSYQYARVGHQLVEDLGLFIETIGERIDQEFISNRKPGARGKVIMVLEAEASEQTLMAYILDQSEINLGLAVYFSPEIEMLEDRGGYRFYKPEDADRLFGDGNTSI
jgi:hypothetical protein